MDGVLANTVEPHYRSWQRLADEEGLPFTRADNVLLLGRSRTDALRLFLGGRSLPEHHERQWMERKNRYFLEEMEAFGPQHALPGVPMLLHAARARGVRLAVASSSRNARAVLKRLHLMDLFEVIADGATVARAKPSPDIFVWTAGALHLPPRRCVVFEDAAAGVEAALAGGFKVVGLGGGPGTEAAHIQRAGLSDAVVADFISLLDGMS